MTIIHFYFYSCYYFNNQYIFSWGRRGRDRLEVGLTTYTISANHH